MTSDRGRADVYAAEVAAFESTSYESLAPLDELVALADVITAAHWWPHGEIRVVAARADARSSVTRQRVGDAPVVRLAGPQLNPATLVHEFAHVLAGLAEGHGPTFRRAHVDLVGYVFGDDEANWLLDAYESIELEMGERRWSAPPVRRATGGPIAL